METNLTTETSPADSLLANKSYEIQDHLFRSADLYALAKYEKTFEWLEAAGKKGGSLLNVGCGAGLFNSMAAKRGFRVTGVEPEAATVALAQRAAKGLDVKVLHGTLDQVPKGEKYEVIVMHDVLEHIQNDAAAVDQLAGLLSDKGLLVISVPALPALFGKHDEDLGHYRRYTKASLTSVLSPRFRVSKIRYYGIAFIPIVFLISVLMRSTYPAGAVTSGWKRVLFQFLCQVDYRISFGSGTSLITLVRPL